ncbi:hypothetical protein NESM_000226300 [Novymonas esmeraldas]|uniref:Uncharacterized protein n=1 Tax=Novymonas esmeraldas TaxID=1808958 RepID=A0AAW0F738_9TRYP
MSFISYVQSLWGPSTDAPPPSGTSAQHLGSGLWPLSAQVREEMKKGTRYNMKVVLRGTRGTGKSTLMAHLSGHPLPTHYSPSSELVASTMRLQGEHCAPHEGTKVDMWEVVEGRQPTASSSSSLMTAGRASAHIPTAQLHEALRVAADARLRDIYAGCQLVIIMVDPRQRSSWEFAKRETVDVPPTCCILYALNFCDVAPATSPTPTGDSVTLDEVQSWCGRVRRATTSAVHRMLEGRPAPAEFSVPPMTAVFSALTGAGMLGVVRALHVASTLLRIAAEEVRVQQLFGLLARQQAMPIAGGDEAPAPPPSAVSGSGDSLAQPPSHDQGRGTAARGALRRTPTSPAPASDPAATAAATAGTASATTQSESALRMQHRCADPLVASGGGTAQTSSGVAGACRHDGSANGPVSDAEAMRLFLGSSGSDGSGRASTRSSSSSSAPLGVAVHPTSRPMPSRHQPPPHQRAAATATTAAPQRGGSVAASWSGSAPLSADEGATAVDSAPRPRLEEPPPAQVARLTAEEVVCSLACTMVRDVDAPADEFFAHTREEQHDGESTTAAAESSGASPASAAPPPGGVGALTARLLETHRVVRRPTSSSTSVATAAATDPALHADVSAILAQMTAALAAGAPAADGAAEATAVDRRITEVGHEGEEPQQQQQRQPDDPSASRPRRSKHSVRDGVDSREQRRRHHRRRQSHVTSVADGTATGAPAEVDDGSFELLLV